MASQKLLLAKNVTSFNEECVTHVVPSGKKVWIMRFHGEAAFSPNSAVKLVWDMGGAGEEILWSIKGGGDIPLGAAEAIEKTGDGVKKMAVCLDNGESGSIFMSGFALLEIED